VVSRGWEPGLRGLKNVRKVRFMEENPKKEKPRRGKTRRESGSGIGVQRFTPIPNGRAGKSDLKQSTAWAAAQAHPGTRATHGRVVGQNAGDALSRSRVLLGGESFSGNPKLASALWGWSPDRSRRGRADPKGLLGILSVAVGILRENLPVSGRKADQKRQRTVRKKKKKG